MGALRQWILSIICASILCGILSDISQKTFFKKNMKLACSFFLAIVLLSPILKWKLPDLEQSSKDFLTQSEEAVRRGESIRLHSVAGRIKQEAEAYILKEAKAIGADVSIQITTDYGDPPVPITATVSGSFDAFCEYRLSRILSEDLGIPKEHQTWIRQDSPTSDNSFPNTPMSY